QKGYPDFFKTLKTIAVDEWHELLGSKRGVQVELAVSRIVGLKKNNQQSIINNQFSIWGISATIGNLDEAKEVLLSPMSQATSPLSACGEGKGERTVIVKAEMKKQLEVESIFPDEIEKFPWAGHLGIKLVEKVIPIINNSRTTLIFINTRGMSEIWYQT